MAFSEAVKLSVNRKAHFRCCICRRHGVSVEVHHIIPQAEGGPDTEDNAVTLCPTCHDEYGANPVKRTAIRAQRDFWYEVCERQHVLNLDMVERLSVLLEGNTAAITGFQNYIHRIMNPPTVIEVPTMQARGELLPPTVMVSLSDGGTVTAKEEISIRTFRDGVEMVEGDDESTPSVDEEVIGDFHQEPRTEIEILEALDRLFDQIWYNRHWNSRIAIEAGTETVDPEIWKQALAAAARVEEKYKDDPQALGPWFDFEWGMLNGKMSALRWVLGDDWDSLDT